MSRVNHELRTPLNAVIGFSEVMALEMFGPLGNERYQEYVRYIRDSAGDLLKSAEDTLALTALLTNARPAEAAIACTLEHAIADAWAFVERKAAGRDVQLDLDASRGCRGSQRAARPAPDPRQHAVRGRRARRARRPRLGSSPWPTASSSRSCCRSAASSRARVPRAGSLAICLARTLLEMQGTSLLEIETAGGWRAVTVLDRAVQPDFFAGRAVERCARARSRRWPSSAQR